MRADKSPQGHYDEDIISLLNQINKHSQFETTSSCSGRITLMKGIKKGEAVWLLKEHQPVHPEDIYDKLQETDGMVRFMYEPFILHIECKDKKSADQLLKLAHTSGIKKVGIISTKRYIVQIVDTGKMEVPLKKDLVTEDYIKFLVEVANERLRSTKDKIKKLESFFLLCPKSF